MIYNTENSRPGVKALHLQLNKLTLYNITIIIILNI